MFCAPRQRHESSIGPSLPLYTLDLARRFPRMNAKPEIISYRQPIHTSVIAQCCREACSVHQFYSRNEKTHSCHYIISKTALEMSSVQLIYSLLLSIGTSLYFVNVGLRPHFAGGLCPLSSGERRDLATHPQTQREQTIAIIVSRHTISG